MPDFFGGIYKCKVPSCLRPAFRDVECKLGVNGLHSTAQRSTPAAQRATDSALLHRDCHGVIRFVHRPAMPRLLPEH